MKHRVLIVDDDRERGGLIARVLESEYEPVAVTTVAEGLAAIRDGRWSAALVDYNLVPHGSGIEILQAMRDGCPPAFRVLYSVYVTEALRADATRMAEAHAVLSAWETGFLVEVRETLARLLPDRPLASPSEWTGGRWVARSAISVAFLEELHRAARSDSPVYLYGEPGTGKSLAAEILRRWREEWSVTSRPAPHGAVRPPVVVIQVPPLRDRHADLPGLAELALADVGGAGPRRLTNAALEALAARPWRGNVRELYDVVKLAARAAGAAREVDVHHLPKASLPGVSPAQAGKARGQRDTVLGELRTAGTVSGAARLEGIPRPNFIRLMRRLGIVRADIHPTRLATSHDDPSS